MCDGRCASGFRSERRLLPVNDRPAVLFLCTHNAGRSRMALGFFRALARGAATAWSGGSEPAHEVNPAAIEVMRERGIDISGASPQRWTAEVVGAADVVITMGCGDACPVVPGKRYEEWVLPDPAGLDTAAVRPIRDDIELRVRALLRELDVPMGDDDIRSGSNEIGVEDVHNSHRDGGPRQCITTTSALTQERCPRKCWRVSGRRRSSDWRSWWTSSTSTQL